MFPRPETFESVDNFYSTLSHLSFSIADQTGNLVITGSVNVGGLSIWELALQDVVVVQPEHLGGRTVFKAKSISVHPAWNILRGACLKQYICLLIL